MANADATTEQDRHLQSPAAHILHLPNLVDDFSGAIKHEIRKHEIDNRPGAAHRGATGQAYETAFANRRVTQALRAVDLIKPESAREISPSFADSFAQDKNFRVLRHFSRQNLQRGFHV